MTKEIIADILEDEEKKKLKELLKENLSIIYDYATDWRGPRIVIYFDDELITRVEI